MDNVQGSISAARGGLLEADVASCPLLAGVGKWELGRRKKID